MTLIYSGNKTIISGNKTMIFLFPEEIFLFPEEIFFISGTIVYIRTHLYGVTHIIAMIIKPSVPEIK